MIACVSTGWIKRTPVTNGGRQVPATEYPHANAFRTIYPLPNDPVHYSHFINRILSYSDSECRLTITTSVGYMTVTVKPPMLSPKKQSLIANFSLPYPVIVVGPMPMKSGAFFPVRAMRLKAGRPRAAKQADRQTKTHQYCDTFPHSSLLQ